MIIKSDYISPLSIVFLWHPDDDCSVKDPIDYCILGLSKNRNNLFSRSVCFPIFLYTEIDGELKDIDFKSKKSLIFTFVSKNIIISKKWREYILKQKENKDNILIPIAIDELASNFNLDSMQYMRFFEFDKSDICEIFYINVLHEIYRWVLNPHRSIEGSEKNNSVKIFLSHTKRDTNGADLAKKLKYLIDQNQMRNFFDVADIANGSKFDEEIISSIKESTFLAILSNSYSSRYWCQREVMCAKDNNRPIVSVDICTFEDRVFPYSSNIPCMYLEKKDEFSTLDLLHILSLTLLETLRFFYSEIMLKEYQRVGWIDSDSLVIYRPPEVADVGKFITFSDGNINCNCKSIVYPEPPLYGNELEFFNKIGIKTYTPLTLNSDQAGRRFGISISDPASEEVLKARQTPDKLSFLAESITKHILSNGATLVYGGDLREGGFTEHILNEALIIKDRLRIECVNVENYVSWPIYKNKNYIDFKAKYALSAKMIECEPPKHINDLIESEDYNSQDKLKYRYIFGNSLLEMRKKRISTCDVCIFAGGKYKGYSGLMPGVLEEFLIAVEYKKPIYVLGGFAGVSSGIVEIILRKIIPEKFTEKWQIENNDEYDTFLSKYGYNYDILYDFEKIKNVNLNNGLSHNDNLILFKTPLIDEAVHYLFKGLSNIEKF